MSTRGFYGMRKNGVLKGSYNHSDSYPSYLGAALAKEIWKNRRNNLFFFAKGFERVELVKNDSEPTKAQIAKCLKAGVVNKGVGNQSENDWYCLLREAQGSLVKAIELGVMIDGQEFLKDSLFCEWAYILDIDKKKLEVYRGFQSSGKKETLTRKDGSTYEQTKYDPVKLLIEVDVKDLRKFDMVTFEVAFHATRDFFEGDE
jgi:hypothetical protein